MPDIRDYELETTAHADHDSGEVEIVSVCILDRGKITAKLHLSPDDARALSAELLAAANELLAERAAKGGE